MSAVIETFLICDGECGTNYGVDTTNHTAFQHRKGAREAGWTYRNGKDYCDKCSLAWAALKRLPAVKG